MASTRLRSCAFAAAGCATSVVIAAVLGVVVLRTAFDAYRQSSGNMEPTVARGDTVLVRPAGTIGRGDVVAFVMPAGGLTIERVVALPGEVIELRQGVAVVNGLTLDEPYMILREGEEPRVPVVRNMEGITVPDDSFFLLGDNRDHSNDSRYFGPVKRSEIRGRVVVVISPESGIWRP